MPFELADFSGIGCTTRPWLADGMDVQDHVVAVNEDPLDFAVGIGKFLAQELEEGFEPFGAIGRIRVVLGIPWAEVSRRRLEIFLVEPFLVKLQHCLLVHLRLLRIGRVDWGCRERDEGRREREYLHDLPPFRRDYLRDSFGARQAPLFATLPSPEP